MRATIVVPLNAPNYDDAVQLCAETLADRYGQVHTYDVRKWYAHDGTLRNEPATIVETYGQVDHFGGITMLAERVREMTDAAGVMATVGGDKLVV